VGQLGFTSFPYQAGLFSAVITAFVVPKIQDLKVDPRTNRFTTCNNPFRFCSNIKQLASIDAQVSTNLTHPPPYPTFHSLSSDFIVTVFWLMSLVFSLCAALAATLVQQWARLIYVPSAAGQPFEDSVDPNHIVRDVGRLQVIAQILPRLIHSPSYFFFLGLIYAIMIIDPFVALVTIAPISICGFYYIYSVIASIMKPRWPYQNRLSNGDIASHPKSASCPIQRHLSQESRLAWENRTGRGQLPRNRPQKVGLWTCVRSVGCSTKSTEATSGHLCSGNPGILTEDGAKKFGKQSWEKPGRCSLQVFK